jgi:predicted nucleotidyltransferase
MNGKSTPPLTKEEIKERLWSVLADKTLQLVLLFGSLATGKGHRRSDVDIGFLFDSATDILDLTNKVTRFLGNDKVDVVDLRRASPLLRFAAARKGIILYERDPGLFSRFYSLSYRMYVDTKKLRDARDMAVRRFLHSGGHG